MPPNKPKRLGIRAKINTCRQFLGSTDYEYFSILTIIVLPMCMCKAVGERPSSDSTVRSGLWS